MIKMLSRLCIVVSILSFASITNSAKLPFFTKCKKSDPKLNDCILSTVKQHFSEFAKGHKSTHLQPLNPIQVSAMNLNVNGILKINLSNVTISGFDESEFTDFKLDLNEKVMNMELDVPSKVNLVAHYDINGRILILPIQGIGPANITYITPHVHYKLTFDITKKNDKQYLTPKDGYIKYTTTRAHYYLENLFNGDPRLGSEMIKFLNENWKEVDEELGVEIARGFAEIFTQILTAFFKKVPLDELFDE